ELWCGNSLCDGTEKKNSCPADCPSVCADNVCEGLENCYNCENDCGKCEGDAFELIYDQNGNLIKDINYEYHFNSFNQLDSVSKRGRQIAQYSYDHNGKRIKKVVFSGSANTTTYYLGNMVRVILGNSSIDTTYYSHDGQLVGSKSNGSTYYYHPDHLGSTNLITDDRGGFVSRSGYMPFGEQIIGMGDRYSFTGQEKDSETELMYYGARYYSPILGRFTQPDTLLQNVYDPQLLNRYSYARNNPLKYTDPSGHAIPVLAFAALMIAIQVIVPAILGYLAGYAVGATADIGKQLYEKRHAERLDIDFNEVNDAGNEIGGPLAASMGTQGLLEGLSLNIGSFLPSTKPVPAKAQTDY
ncbi:MAG TPA: RHS repeat-associated core domain-containing protein, partial [Candidatus Nanoarchaeia archaeon]|nr:RHS repeat-associated core domain-containing protein [Candidatus Nanoarchaeia archaeon]